MERNISMDEISDGKLYDLNDMVKANCQNCEGCSACCQGMGSSIILDPLDIYQLEKNLEVTFEGLMAERIELNVVDGVILPNLKMAGKKEACSFLNEEGRCSIHGFRPGICRLFPLGRFYENNSFQYFLQVHECKKENRSKVKVSRWIDTPDLKKNQKFVCDWHYFQKDVQNVLKSTQNDELIKKINMYVLNQFFVAPYDTDTDFYEQFDGRMTAARKMLFGEQTLLHHLRGCCIIQLLAQLHSSVYCFGK